jgi:hypothetical protein
MGVTWAFGAPRGIRTPNRQIRSLAPAVSGGPDYPFASLFGLVSRRVAGSSQTSVHARLAWHGGNVVAVPGRRGQTGVWPAESPQRHYGAADYLGDLVVAFVQQRLQAQGGQAS